MKSYFLVALFFGLLVATVMPSARAQLIITSLSASSNHPGTSTMATLSLSVSIENPKAQTQSITLSVFDTGFTLPAPGPLTFTTTTSGTFSPVAGTGATLVDGSAATVKTFGDAGNVSGGTGFPAEDFTATAPANSAMFAYSDTSSVPGFNPSGPYSLMIRETFTLAGNTILTDANTTLVVQPAAAASVPEPGSLGLLGAGALSMLVLAWRRGKIAA